MEVFSGIQTEGISEVVVFVGDYLEKLVGLVGELRQGKFTGFSFEKLELNELKVRLESAQEILKTFQNDEASNSVFIASAEALLTFNRILEHLNLLQTELIEACLQEDWTAVADLIDFELAGLIDECQLVLTPSEA